MSLDRGSTTSCITPATWNLMSEMASRAGASPEIDRPGRMENQQSRGVDCRAALGDPVLDGLPAAECITGCQLA